MKKLSMLILSLLAISGFITAQTFKATGGVNWDIGYDADHKTSGFEVAFQDLRFDAMVGDPQTVEKTGENAPYGSIAINGLRVMTDDDNSHTAQYMTPQTTIQANTDWGSRNILLRWNQLSAKLVFSDSFNIVTWFNNYNAYYHAVTFTTYNGDGYGISNAYAYSLYSGVYGQTDVSSSLYNGWELAGHDPAKPTNKVFFKASNYSWNAPKDNAFVTVNYSIPAIADISAQVGSYKSYQDASRYFYDPVTGKVVDNGSNGYSGILTAKLTAVQNLTAVVAAAGDLGVPDKDYSSPAFGGKIQYNIALGEALSIKPSVYADCQLADIDTYNGYVKSTDGLDYAVAGGIEAAFSRSVATVIVGYGNDGNTTKDIKSLRGTAALNFKTIDNLTLQAAAEYVDDNLDVTKDESMGFHGYVAYAIVSGDQIYTPYFEASSTNLSHLDDYDFYAKAGVSITGLMANTTFKLFWDSNDLTGKFTPLGKDDSYGRIVFRTSINF